MTTNSISDSSDSRIRRLRGGISEAFFADADRLRRQSAMATTTRMHWIPNSNATSNAGISSATSNAAVTTASRTNQ